MISNRLSAKFANIAFVCACLVVFIHVKEAGVTGDFSWSVSQLIEKGVARCAIPWFLFASGFWLAGKFDKIGWYRHLIGDRLKSLVVPYFCWCLIYGVFSLCLSASVSVAHGRVWTANFPIGIDWLRWVGLSTSPWFGPMWYIQSLVGLTLISPALALDRFGVIMIISGVLWCFGVSCPDLLCFNWMRLFFFAIGVMARRHSEILERLDGGRWTVIGWIGALGLLGISWCRMLASQNVHFLHPGAYADWYVRCVAVIGVPVLWLIVPCKDVRGLRQFAFPLYLLHCFVLGPLNPLFPSRMHIGWWIVLGAITIVCCFALTVLIRKNSYLSQILFGGR